MKRMIKMTCAILAVSALMFTGCEAGSSTSALSGPATGIEMEENAKQAEADTTYYSTFLGLEITVPEEWWLYKLNGVNLREDNSDADSDAVILEEGGDESYKFLDLLTFANLQYSSSVGHFEFSAIAEQITGIWGLNEFNEENLDYLVRNNSNLGAEVTLSEDRVINGKNYKMNIVAMNGAEEPFEITTLVTEAKNGYFITFMAKYWEEASYNGQQVAIETIENYVKFTEGEE